MGLQYLTEYDFYYYFRIAVPKATPAGYGQGKLIKGSLESDLSLGGLGSIGE